MGASGSLPRRAGRADVTRMIRLVEGHDAESILALAEANRKGLTGFGSKAVLAELDRRHDEMVAALDWFIDADRVDDARRLVGGVAIALSPSREPPARPAAT